MDKASSARVLARTLLQSAAPTPMRRIPRIPPSLFTSQRCSAAPLQRRVRPFSSSAAVRADDTKSADGTTKVEEALSNMGRPAQTQTATAAPSSRNLMEGLADLLPSSKSSGVAGSGSNSAATAAAAGSSGAAIDSTPGSGQDDFDRMKHEVDHSTEEYHFCVYSHKHNTHVTVSKPNRDVIVSMSCGNLGFRKAQRGSYDAGYQLGAYVCDRLYQRGWHKTIQKMEVTLRGFGAGREAVSKILLGSEGRLLRNKITRVADGTRLKFGGTRSKKPRRLG